MSLHILLFSLYLCMGVLLWAPKIPVLLETGRVGRADMSCVCHSYCFRAQTNAGGVTASPVTLSTNYESTGPITPLSPVTLSPNYESTGPITPLSPVTLSPNYEITALSRVSPGCRLACSYVRQFC